MSDADKPDLFTVFDPLSVNPLALEAGHPLLLTVLDDPAQLPDLAAGIQLLQANSTYLSWAIWVDEKLAPEACEPYLAKAPESLELMLLPAGESGSLAEVYAAACGYFDPGPRAHPPQAWLAAQAMNLPIFCRQLAEPGPLVTSGLCPLAPDSDGSEILAWLAQGPPKRPLRGKLMQQLTQRGQIPSPVTSGLDWLAAHVAELEVAAIVFWGRSGSVLLHSLLDLHPRTISYGDGNFAALSCFSQIWAFLEQGQHSHFHALIEAFCSARRDEHVAPELVESFALFEAADPEYEACFKACFHQVIQTLGQALGLTALQTQTRKVFFIALHYAYYLALGLPIAGRNLIVFQHHWVEDLPQLADLCQDFPRLKVLGMFRHPARGLYSMLAHVRRNTPQQSYPNWEDLVFSARYLATWRHLLMGWRLAETLVGAPVYAISLEALHARPESTLRALADYLGIEWNASLMKSTRNGGPVVIESGVHGRINEQTRVFDPERIAYQGWREQLSEFDSFVLEGLLHAEMEKIQGQPVPALQKSLAWLLAFVPLRMERKALQAAFYARDEARIKQVLLNLAERWFVTMLFVCGHVYQADSALGRWTQREYLGIRES